MQSIKGSSFEIGENTPLTFILGPCVIEGEEKALQACAFIQQVTKELGISFIYKSSYDKANRSSLDSYRGPGLEKGLKILKKVKNTFKVPIFTDVHTPEEALQAGEVCDFLQVPAFLCRQTDLLIACGKTQKPISLKKGQFLAPWDMEAAIQKITAQGNHQVLLTERGTSFGYNNLVADLRSIPIMQELGYPVCFDATHSLQLPGKDKKESGGDSRFVPYLAKAAVAAGCNAIYMETHPNPKEALSDKKTQLPFSKLKKLLQTCLQIQKAIK